MSRNYDNETKIARKNDTSFNLVKNSLKKCFKLSINELLGTKM